jgi:dihydroorotate dehydrogenase electron transfer subunit
MSLSSVGRREATVTVRSVGEVSDALNNLKKGDKVGVRGPFGNGFTIVGSSPLIVAGGIGAASLSTLAEAMVAKNMNPTFILGAKSYDQLVFKSRLANLLGEGFHISTDDGSYGYRGLNSDYATELMDKKSFDYVYTCGPELMMVKIFNEAEKRGIPIQASLERYIKCAVGLCGSCCIGPFRVCVDGPVFNSKQLRTIKNEFGTSKKDPSGRRIMVDH